MIIEKCKKLEKKFDEYKLRKELESDAQSLGNCQELINNGYERLSINVLQFDLFKELELLEKNDLPDIEKVFEKLNTVHQNFKETYQSITQGNNFNLLINYLKKEIIQD